MPRYARNNISSKFIHLMIQGINKEYIFKDDIEIKTYLRYLRQKIKDTNVKIISYCMMNNHAHILIYYKDIDDMLFFIIIRIIGVELFLEIDIILKKY